MTTHIRESTQLSPDNWTNLAVLAELTGSTTKVGGGKPAGSPSWRALLRRIAQGEIGLTDGRTIWYAGEEADDDDVHQS